MHVSFFKARTSTKHQTHTISAPYNKFKHTTYCSLRFHAHTYAICIILAIDLGISSLINFPPAAISAFLGKFVLFAIAYIAYHIVMIVFLCQDSEPFENRYGESPKYVVDPDSDGIDTPDAKID